jgi:hypothetical protein
MSCDSWYMTANILAALHSKILASILRTSDRLYRCLRTLQHER